MTSTVQKILRCEDQAAWERWLTDHHDNEPYIWLTIDKVNAAKSKLGLADAVNVALCFGWIDGRPHPLDTERYLLRFSPRTSKSRWSFVNRNRAEALMLAGKMRESGLAMIQIAKSNGTWEGAYTSRVRPMIPDDLKIALANDDSAQRNFDTWSNSQQVQAIQWLNEGKRAKTRANRILKIVSAAKSNRKLP